MDCEGHLESHMYWSGGGRDLIVLRDSLYCVDTLPARDKLRAGTLQRLTLLGARVLEQQYCLTMKCSREERL